MAYSLDGFYADQNAGGQRIHKYTTTDTIATVATDGYFDDLDQVLAVGNRIAVYADSDGNPSWFELMVTAVSTGDVTVTQVVSQELTASGAITPGVQSIELNHATVAVAATVATSLAHQGLFVMKDTSASGTAAHTVTLTAGTLDGTNTVATFNAPNECLVVWFDSAGDGTIVENVGTVALS